MSYTIQLTNGNIFTVIPDGTTASASSYITLVGKNYAGYGQYLDDNFVRLLENGSNNTAPGNALVGQLWFDSGNSILKVNTATGFKSISSVTSSSSAPANPIAGDLWFNTGTQQLEVWTGSAWLIVGPQVGVFMLSNSASTSNNTSTTGSITVNGANGSPTIAIVNGAGAGVGNIGSAAVPFNTVFATATTAEYADVAERFAADDIYEAGTVVELGGTAEITKSNTELSESVFGVISTRAAYLMNSGAGTNDTHPPVAMTGRVPVRVIGVVRKGDRLVSAGNGIARSAQAGEATAFNVIGRALADKSSVAEGTVEAIVTTK
jgi:hypothetical protein